MTGAAARCRVLLEEAETLRHGEPRRAVDAAAYARDAAARVADLPRAAWLALQAEAWSVLGTAHRAAGDWRRAEEAFLVALAFLDAPERDEEASPLLRPRLAQRAAYLRRDQGRIDEALRLLDDAVAAFRRRGEEGWLAAALVDRGLVLGRAGRHDEAVATLAAALARLDPATSPRNVLAATHGVALYLHELAETRPELDAEARAWLDVTTRLHRRAPLGPVADLKLRMLVARTALRDGRIDEGVAELWRVHDELRRHGAVYEQVFALLHLATAHLRRAERRQLESLAGHLFPLLRRLVAPPEVAAALLRFAGAMRRGAVDEALLADVRRTLQQAPRFLAGRAG